LESQVGVPPEEQLAGVVARNIRALLEAERVAAAKRTRSQRVADAITGFAGSMKFVVLHAVLFGGWLVFNSGGIPAVRPFDPFPFVMLAMFASVEAIFLSTFVLISQNRMTEQAERRSHLDLQVDLLAEHEITRLVTMVEAVSRRLGVVDGKDNSLEELKQDVAPEKVLEALDRLGEQH
jgi:uncharacterized membrane protein